MRVVESPNLLELVVFQTATVSSDAEGSDARAVKSALESGAGAAGTGIGGVSELLNPKVCKSSRI
jgi:hypothetical protein